MIKTPTLPHSGQSNPYLAVSRNPNGGTSDEYDSGNYVQQRASLDFRSFRASPISKSSFDLGRQMLDKDNGWFIIEISIKN